MLNLTLYAKINEVKGKILSIIKLAITTVLTAVKNKIPNVTNIVKTKLTITQKLMKLKKKLQIMIIVISILLHMNLIN